MTSPNDPASRKRGRLPSLPFDSLESLVDGAAAAVAAAAAAAPATSPTASNAWSSPGSMHSGVIPHHPKPMRQPQPIAPNLSGLRPGDDPGARQIYPAKTHISPESPAKAPPAAARGNASTSFRNVSACNRCRLRKNRCDQDLPACQACQKAGTRCVGFDPFLNREIPRSYVYYLETRTAYLERLLKENQIEYSSPEDFSSSSGPDGDHPVPEDGYVHKENLKGHRTSAEQGHQDAALPTLAEEKLVKKEVVSELGLQHIPEPSTSNRLGPTSGLSFSRVMFAAVKSSMPKSRAPSTGSGNGATSMRDSVFGLSTKTNIKEAPFPDRDLGLKLVELYFEHANPQIPILHRSEFMAIFDEVYNRDNTRRTSRESYLLNIVFAIGAGIILDTSDKQDDVDQDAKDTTSSAKKARRAGHQYQPEEYHAAAIVHLEHFLGTAGDSSDGFGRGLEQLQAVLLLAAFALLRPVPPGLWYIAGNAVRLAVDLGLHYEDGADIGNGQDGGVEKQEDPFAPAGMAIDESEIGRRQWMRDLRRRLWWCAYTFDRLVGTVVGRPFSISDQVVTTEFPSALDDTYITRSGFLEPPNPDHASYKHVAHHYFRLRLLQSEIVQVLQYQSAQKAHQFRHRELNPFMHTNLSSPFMHRFTSFRAWRDNVHQRLYQWKMSAPTSRDAGVQFDPQFLELNYWQAVILLYRQSVTTPAAFADDMKSVNDGMDSPHSIDIEEENDEEEMIYLRIAEAGKNVLKIYRHLHRLHLVNYTFLATHHLFMAGISFLYAIWHSNSLRSYLSLDDVDSTLLAASSVLQDLIPKCPPAEACKTAFDRMSKATVQMCMSTTGFGPQASAPRRKFPGPGRPFHGQTASGSSRPRPAAGRGVSESRSHPMGAPGRLQTHFDMDFSGLLSGGSPAQQFTAGSAGIKTPNPSIQQQKQQRQAPSTSPPTSDYRPNAFEYFTDTSGPAASTPARSQLAEFSPTTTFAKLAASPVSNTSQPTAGYPSFAPQQAAEQPQSQSQPQGPSYFDPMSNSLGNLSDMSFLDDDAGLEMDQLMDADPSNLHLFGIGGMDGTHDWREGKDMDLFGGFFFGNGGAAS